MTFSIKSGQKQAVVMLDDSDKSEEDECMEMEMDCLVVIVLHSNIDVLKIVCDFESKMPNPSKCTLS
jgi:hypothetical protein